MISEPDSSSRSINETVNGSHNFTIRGYSLTKGMDPGKCISSDTFSVGGYDWVIYFYPDGKSADELRLYVSVYIGLASEVTDVRALFELTLLDQSGKGNHKVFGHSERGLENGPRTLNHKGCMWGFDRFFKKTSLETSDFLKDDCLSMHCTVRVVRTRVEVPKLYNVAIPPPDMGKNLKYLLDDKVGCDITFQVVKESFRGKLKRSFKAHKLILAARSPVFRDQFIASIGNHEELEIDDIDPIIFEALLDFIYTDELPYFDGSFIQLLLDLADRFGLDRLKQSCEAKLCEAISAETVATTLSLAEQHHCPQLKAICLKFAATNLAVVMQSEGFKHLEESCPSLLSELKSVAPNRVSGKKRSASSKDLKTVARSVDPHGWRDRLRSRPSYLASQLEKV